MLAKILVVEDDPDIMRILMHALTGAGFKVIPAYGGGLILDYPLHLYPARVQVAHTR